MKKITVDLGEYVGQVKPMHAVNNGPVYKFTEAPQVTNIDSFREAGIPYVRNHDASYYGKYGGEHTVDVHAIFKDFDADPYNEASYDFACTDEYLKAIDFAGIKTFYRLGSKIEHSVKKYGTLPPKDFGKWAVICEHIIRHYNYGWANGFDFGLEYWEIWNEPDLDADDAADKRTWGGTKAQFFDLYEIASKHLKACFPDLKIGGPSIAGKWEWGKDFILEMKKRNAPLDFFSWHCYASKVENVKLSVEFFRKTLDDAGFARTESILSEWNYICGWSADKWIDSIKVIKNHKGAAFSAAVMETCQNLGLDMLMYYDARPCWMNGLFESDLYCNVLKGYYPFCMFNEVYKLKNAVAVKGLSEELYGCAASDGCNSAVMITRYSDKENYGDDIELEIIVPDCPKGAELEFYLLDEENDNKLIRCESSSSGVYSGVLSLKMHSTVLVKIKNC